ncbi:MAG: CoB--CoM heterodisulfide reductase iron-sulfur subunit B family protein [Deltaproteobacteria bacterium]
MTLRYAYYPGCASQAITKESNDTTRKVAALLGMELCDMPAANCCGAGLLKDYDYMLHLSLNARVFSQAEKMGLDILTICSTCLMIMRTANDDMKRDAGLLKNVNEILFEAGLEYKGTVEIKQLLWVLKKDYGLENLKKKVTRPLDWLKVAPFYGCHSLRPSTALGFDDPENPSSLEDVLRSLGAHVVEYGGRTKCCGFQADLVNLDSAVALTADRLLDAKNNGADCMVTPCPFCHINLDNYQGIVEKKIGTKIGLPVFHLSQMVGLSMGMTPDELGLNRHLVTPKNV